MPVDIGTVVDGKITGITKFGAFVELPEGKVGLVHISQIANTFVKDLNEFVKVGDQVKVKVLGEPKPGKYDLSMKQAQAPGSAPAAGGGGGGGAQAGGFKAPPRAPSGGGGHFRHAGSRKKFGKQKEMHPPGSFEDKITKFLKHSDDKLMDVKRNLQYKTGERKKGKNIKKKTNP